MKPDTVFAVSFSVGTQQPENLPDTCPIVLADDTVIGSAVNLRTWLSDQYWWLTFDMSFFGMTKDTLILDYLLYAQDSHTKRIRIEICLLDEMMAGAICVQEDVCQPIYVSV